jgi:hypothetical protein
MKDSIISVWATSATTLTVTNLGICKEWLNVALLIATIAYTLIRIYTTWHGMRNKKGGEE